jgi:hypothetical protein
MFPAAIHPNLHNDFSLEISRYAEDATTSRQVSPVEFKIACVKPLDFAHVSPGSPHTSPIASTFTPLQVAMAQPRVAPLYDGTIEFPACPNVWLSAAGWQSDGSRAFLTGTTTNSHKGT